MIRLVRIKFLFLGLLIISAGLFMFCPDALAAVKVPITSRPTAGDLPTDEDHNNLLEVTFSAKIDSTVVGEKIKAVYEVHTDSITGPLLTVPEGSFVDAVNSEDSTLWPESTLYATNLSSGKTYYFKIKTVSQAGEESITSAWWQITATPGYITLPAIPIANELGLETSASIYGSSIIPHFGYTGSWTGLYGYKIEYKLDGATSWTVLKNNSTDYFEYSNNNFQNNVVDQFIPTVGLCNDYYKCYKMTSVSTIPGQLYHFRVSLAASTYEGVKYGEPIETSIVAREMPVVNLHFNAPLFIEPIPEASGYNYMDFRIGFDFQPELLADLKSAGLVSSTATGYEVNQWYTSGNILYGTSTTQWNYTDYQIFVSNPISPGQTVFTTNGGAYYPGGIYPWRGMYIDPYQYREFYFKARAVNKYVASVTDPNKYGDWKISDKITLNRPAPTITNISIKSLNPTQAEISFKYDFVASGKTYFDIQKSLVPNADNQYWTDVQTQMLSSTSSPSLSVGSLIPGTTYYFRVKPTGTDSYVTYTYSKGGLVTLGPSCIDIAFTTGAIGNPIKASQINELREAINNCRLSLTLTNFNFENSSPTDVSIGSGAGDNPLASGGKIRAIHLTQLRKAIEDIYDILVKAYPDIARWKTKPVWTDPTITPNATQIKKAHFQQIRDELLKI